MIVIISLYALSVVLLLTHSWPNTFMCVLIFVVAYAVPQDQPGQWQQLVGRAAPAFQTIRAAVPPGPWKPFREQVSWMLLLLASKAPANRALISRVQRTTLTPLAMQLENAERFAEQAALVEAAAAAAAAAGAAAGGRESASKPASLLNSPVQQRHSRNPSRGDQQQQQQQSPVRTPLPGASSSSSSPEKFADPQSAAAAAGRTGSSSRASVEYAQGAAAAAAAYMGSPPPPAAAAAATAVRGGVSKSVTPERGDSGLMEDDELSMLQAEVAFLGLMSNNSSFRGQQGEQ